MYQRHSLAGSVSVQLVRSRQAPWVCSFQRPWSTRLAMARPAAAPFASRSTVASRTCAAAGYLPSQRPIRHPTRSMSASGARRSAARRVRRSLLRGRRFSPARRRAVRFALATWRVPFRARGAAAEDELLPARAVGMRDEPRFESVLDALPAFLFEQFLFKFPELALGRADQGSGRCARAKRRCFSRSPSRDP